MSEKNFVPLTVADWLVQTCEKQPSALAILGIETGRREFTWHELYLQSVAVRNQLLVRGLDRHSVVALCAPDGPAALATLLGVMTISTVFPLNPGDPQPAVDRLFNAVRIDAVVAARGRPTAVHHVAESRGVPLIELNADAAPGEALFPESLPTPTGPAEFPTLDDGALYVATAGSTAHPKVVCLTHRSLHVSINHTANWMSLSPGDRGLCVMPLTHMHGIVRSSLPGLLRGGQIVCSPGFDPIRMPQWLDHFQPSYFTGVPSIYRNLIRRAEVRDWRPASKLRLIVCGSDAITDAEIRAAETLFRAPLLQFYSMSEVAPPIAETPPHGPPLPEGAVGRINATWDVACLNDSGCILPAGEIGEIAVRGGIINRLVSEPGSQRFIDGRFRTGDLGRLDGRGNLFYLGRVDGRINRAGKKINVAEVEQAFADHAAVSQAVAFAVPDAQYGQRVGLAVVLRPGFTATEGELLRHAATQLAGAKLPERLVITESLPLLGPGKVDRRGLAQHLGLAPEAGCRCRIERAPIAAPLPSEPRAHAERVIGELFGQILERSAVAAQQDFFELGGNSVLAVKLTLMIEEAFGVAITVADLIEDASVRGLALAVSRRAGLRNDSCIVPISVVGNRLPLFMATGLSGWPVIYRDMGERLRHVSQPFYSFQSPDEPTVERMAGRCLRDLIRIQPRGPYYVGGFSFGALLAMELASRLRDQGEVVGRVILLDPPLFRRPLQMTFFELVRRELRLLASRRMYAWRMRRQDGLERKTVVRNMRACDTYRCQPMHVPVTLVVSQERTSIPGHVDRWKALAKGVCDFHVVPSLHCALLSVGHVERVTDLLIASLHESPRAG
jgi:acyl-CoA synthetase (AMP-forming)/AMP-acid ligase II/thioesterase domain-containing protein